MSRALISMRVVDRVAIVTLDNPDRRNALSMAMRDELIAHFDELEERAGIGAVVVTGAGDTFCSGGDITELATGSGETFRLIYDAFLRVANSSLPTIAAVNGPAVGAGLNLALACDVRLVARSSRFVTRFLQIGLHPGGGGAWMLQRLVQSEVATAMLIFGEELDGEAAVRAHLALKCVDDDHLLDAATELASRAASVPRELALRVKGTLNELARVDNLEDAVALEFTAQLWSAQQDFFQARIAQVARPAVAR